MATATTKVFSVNPVSGSEKVTLDLAWTAGQNEGLAAGYTSATTVQLASDLCLFAYNKTSHQADIYKLEGAKPWITSVASKVSLDGGPWDTINTFVLGNEPYLVTYRADTGAFAFFHIGKDLALSPPYSFYMARNTPTPGFTTIAPFTSLSGQYFLGYNINDGTVAAYNISVIPTSAGSIPPLIALNVWYHRWARGWTRFVFFQLGGANFFFKINTAKLNVNIDHLQDNPAAGTIEVGTTLQSQLPDALKIDIATLVPWSYGDPYFLTYIASTGQTAVYHIHADCKGWDEAAAQVTTASATQIISYRIGTSSYALLYGAA